MQEPPLFPLGRITVTPTIYADRPRIRQVIRTSIRLHAMGYWGDLPPDNRYANDYALENRGRILSCYQLQSGSPVWVVTEADRSATTVLLPAEY